MNDTDRQFLTNIRTQGYEDEWILLKNREDPEIERYGGGTSMLIGRRLFQAMAAYVLDHDLTAFRRLLRETAEMRLSLLRRFDLGEPISSSLVTLLAHRELFLPLALGDREMSREFAERLITKEQLSRRQIRPIDMAFGMCLCSFVVHDQTAMEKWTVEFANRCQRPGGKKISGYLDVFSAMLEQNIDGINQGLDQVAKLHLRQCTPSGVLSVEDRDLCVWGVGMVNLARWCGFPVGPRPPLIPAELLVSLESDGNSQTCNLLERI